MSTSPYSDLASFTGLPRMTGLALDRDGTRLVATVQGPDAKRSRYVSSLWEIPIDGGEPQRLTRSEQGETGPAFRPDGSLLFVSSRPDPAAPDDEEAAIWTLGARGEARPLVRRAGGLGGPVVARDAGTVLLLGSRLVGSTEDDDAERRKTRKERKIDAILHTGMPIRHWDHELGTESPHLFLLDDGVLRDLVPDAGAELVEAAYSVSADGATVVTTWRARRAHGRVPSSVEMVDVGTGDRTTLAAADDVQFFDPAVSPDGLWVAVGREDDGTFDTPLSGSLAIVSTSVGEIDEVDLGDLYPTSWAWAPDSRTLYVAGDFHGRGAVVAVDPETSSITRRLACDAAYSDLCIADDAVYALRSGYDCASAPVRLDPRATDQAPTRLPTPAPTPELPGRLVSLDVDVEGTSVHAWLCLPADTSTPAPVMLWIHGGPFLSYNSWNWRWNPWVAVANGWAVVLPDPALSTGYGQSSIDRAWPYRADVVWHELEGVLDAVLQRPEVNAAQVACLGGSFGGFMTNWIAGHTDRFGAIVTHAGLWALDQQHATTDAADYKTGIFGRLHEHPEWYAAYSPHNFVDEITTPMLVVHGNRDYRVPVSEALRLWWDLVSTWRGDPDDLPHRFLQLPGENHWVLSPGNAQIWYETVLGFCAQHVLGRPWTRPELL